MELILNSRAILQANKPFIYHSIYGFCAIISQMQLYGQKNDRRLRHPERCRYGKYLPDGQIKQRLYLLQKLLPSLKHKGQAV